ncbi:transglycosylase domain-containing protein [Salibacter sp.]|uniref:penicillin-binding protein 1A n=1 Tax=Salibacter sp. TaxID=2010995 RepID=UPI0028707057|nr:transglycosylase domain-containing protein [Salibacter sp.]MDR9398132.1 transglycosylase domain-containing protein [Salibacter sp.]MDR9487554.1 transglycosylase domain-containing protein [Salibacter sp.]
MTEKKKEKRKSSYGKYILAFWLIYFTGFAVTAGYFLALSRDMIWELPSFEELENPQTNLASEIISTDGELIGKYFSENRTRIDFENIPDHMVEALISTEDERFYQHSGIDVRGTVRAVAFLGTRGGASTISQQLAKQLYHEPAATIIERLKQKTMEWVIATQLERQYTKEEIITMYLNKFDFVNNAVGVESAADVYFNTSADSLSLPEAATLVGMAKNPSLFNPNRRPDTTLFRRNVVFGQMLRNNAITQQQFDSLAQLPLGLKFKRVDHSEGMAPYFREVLRMKLKELFNEKNEDGNYKIAKPNGDPYSIYSDGLKIYTTLHSRLQEYAEWAVKKHLSGELQPDFWNDLERVKRAPFANNVSENQINRILQQGVRWSDRYYHLNQRGVEKDSIEWYFNQPVDMTVFSWDGPIDTVMTPMDSIRYHKSFLHAGLMSLDPKSGEVRAWVGGINHNYFAYDHVVQGRRQVGSTFKPFVYALAIENGLSPCKKVPDIPVTFKKGTWNMLSDWTPSNSDTTYKGEMVTLKFGLANSMNNITAWVMKQYGPVAVIEYCRRLGITSPLDTVPSLALGVADISLYEMVGAHATFVNEGIWQKPLYITRIENKSGAVIKEFMPKTREAMSEQNAYTMLELMKGVTMGAEAPDGRRRGTGIRLHFDRPYANIPWDRPIAGKTGTTQNNSDGWFMGSTPDLVTGVWVGAEDRSVHFRYTSKGQGANTALPIWGYYMNKVWADSALGISTGDFKKPENYNMILDCDKYNQSNVDIFGDSDNQGFNK